MLMKEGRRKKRERFEKSVSQQVSSNKARAAYAWAPIKSTSTSVWFIVSRLRRQLFQAKWRKCTASL